MAASTWSTTDKTASLTLSGSNLIATASTNSQGVRGKDPKRTGKYYIEYTSTTTQNAGSIVGLATAATPLALGTTASAVLFASSTTQARDSFGAVAANGSAFAFTTGSVVGCAVDLDNALIWFRSSPAGNWNNSAANNPATGVGGLDISATGVGHGIDAYPYTLLGNNTNSVTANFGGSAFTGTVPSGFTSGWDDSVSVVTSEVVTQVAVEQWQVPSSPAMQLTQASVEQWQVPVPVIQLTQIAVEEWASTSPAVQLTQIAIEEWGSVSFTYAQNIIDSISSSDIWSSSAPLFGTLSDTISASDTFGETFATPEVLSDTVISSDTLSYVLVLTATLSDTVTSADLLTYTFTGMAAYTASLSDSVASSDTFSFSLTSFSERLFDLGHFTDTFSILGNINNLIADHIRSVDIWNGWVVTKPAFTCGPIPLFPPLPQGFPVKVSIVLDTTVGTTKSLREMRVQQQAQPVWDIEILFEELLSQTQNQGYYPPFITYTDYETLVGFWLQMYGQTALFAFDCPWDDSRTDQFVAIGDGTTSGFRVYRNWGTGATATAEPVGMIGTIVNVKFDGNVQDPIIYTTTRTFINFNDPPPSGTVITMTFYYYYVCRFVEDEQSFEEFSKNRWTVPSLKFRAVYWPECNE